MSQLLKNGQKVGSISVEKLLGSGGQGEVYAVKDAGGNKLALKWYFKAQATAEQEKIIRELVNKYHPGPEFLWPNAIIKDASVAGFGYTMPLRPSDYFNLSDLMKRKADPSFRALIMASYRLVNGFHWLHQKGLCYRDISFGNAFFKVDTGEILICDNDNVAPISVSNKANVNGTPKFMAPEIVRGESGPNSNTDLFSLSILNFYFFFISHPLDGKNEADIKCFDLPAMRKLYGINPLYIFHPTDTSNRPVAGIQDNAIIYKAIYPAFFLKLFERSFVDGLVPTQRVALGEWRTGLTNLLGQLNVCSKCKAENFGGHGTCWNCKSKYSSGGKITTSTKQQVILQSGTKCYAEAFGKNIANPFSEVIFEVTQNPADPSKWGLKNTTPHIWTVERPNAQPLVIESGRNLPLIAGYKVNINQQGLWFEIGG